MAKESAGVEQEVEPAGAAQLEEEVVDGLEQADAVEEPAAAGGVEAQSVDHGALAQATESDGAGADQTTASDRAMGPAGQAAPGIDAKRDARDHKRFERREKQRKKQTTARNKKRAAGKDWTADQLAAVLKKEGASGVLCALNQRQPKQGVETLKTANQWDPLINALPVGAMGAGSRRAVDQMIADDVFDIEDAKKLFHPRFGHVAQDVGKSWSTEVMRTVWRQLSLLPASDVTKSTAITTFDAIADGGAYGPSWEDPANINTVQIGQDINGDHETLESTVRHEIGHGVHTQIPTVVNKWLQDDMQFWFTDFDSWIRELGGYPAKFQNSSGAWVNVDDAWRGYLRGLVEGFTGDGGWDPAKPTPEDGEPADGQAAWAAMPPAVKNACAQSTSYWYDNYTNFQQKSGKRYFLNHYYHRPFTIGATAFATIPSTNDTYTAMSEKEFFANCYAEYFSNPAGVSDHSKWGGTLPGNVKSFFSTCIVSRQPYDKFKKKQKANKSKH